MHILDRIREVKDAEVQKLLDQGGVSRLQELVQSADAPRGFLRALSSASQKPALIAECKKASPSQGLIRPNYIAAELAQIYQSAGAQALSVLTDAPFFQGSLEDLITVRKAVSLPLLRKDFVIHPVQVIEARATGADAVLLIVRFLQPALLLELHALACELGMDVLVETHNAAEVEWALEQGFDLIGLNHRNLDTFETSHDLAGLVTRISSKSFAVSESALSSREDVEAVSRLGAGAVLIGTAFCRSNDPGSKVKEVMGW